MKYKATNIEWDTDDVKDDELPDLPKTVKINFPKYLNVNTGKIVDYDLVIDDVLNYISNKYGFCIKNCVIEIMST